ncbi:MAG: histidine phosphatase family protein [Tissierellia bacterium]|jgi:broad specificity phosphatase PhoE|nr:histidine phosphatase family protein [Tissierellia bacterium]MDD3225960.1 histidine phosphatase family protein [Tissierellia bacterium]MDD4046050.1 histidine phosphatase family protein [Tissierellia bacterium]MDD4677574.1 histidine phosphatase family protein [Tissierellia bacterium]
MIYLVRHGQSEANVSRRFSGITDVELTETGILQAVSAGKKLKGKTIHKIFSSPLKRAKNTAELIADEIGFNKKDIIIENRLTEVNFGIFENLTWEEIIKMYADEIENWIKFKHKYKFPKGEGYDDIIDRVSGFMDNVPDNSLISTHYGVIQAVLLYFKIVDDVTLWDYKISNCDIFVVNNKKIEKIIRCGLKS